MRDAFGRGGRRAGRLGRAALLSALVPALVAGPAGPAAAEVVVFTAQLLPSLETPPITNAEADAFGTAVVTLDVARDAGGAVTGATARFDVGLSRFPDGEVVNGAHVHQGAPGMPGPIVLSGGITAGNAVPVTGDTVFTRASLTVDPALASSILADPTGFYFNVHTNLNPDGAVRGQLSRSPAFEGLALGVFTDAARYGPGDPIQLKAFVGNFGGTPVTADVFAGFGLPADQGAALCGAAGDLPLFFVGAAGTGLECFSALALTPPPLLARSLTIPPFPLTPFTLFSGVVPPGTLPGTFFAFLGAAAPGTFPAGALKVDTQRFPVGP